MSTNEANGFFRASARPRLLSRWWQLLCAGIAALAAPCGFALDPAENPANYIATRWNTEDGLPHNSIKQILQSRDGYIWVGTLQGLARFDGLTFTVFTQHNTPSFPNNNQITSFAETRDGSLWIGTALGLARYRNGRFTSYDHSDGLKADTINAVCVAPDGSLWIGGREGVTRWVDGKFVNDIDTSPYNMAALRSIFVDRQNAIWLSAGFDALRYAEGKFTRFSRAEGLPAQSLEMIREDAAGRIIAVTQTGVFRLEAGRFTPLRQDQAFSAPSAHTALADRAGNLWIGSPGGLDRYFDGKVVSYTDRSSNKLGVVDALFEDREGCLWVGTSVGLHRLTDRRASTLSTQDGLSGMLVVAVKQTHDGAVWVSSWAGGVDRFQNGAVTHYALGAPLSQGTVTVIHEAPDGTVWLGNRGSSLDRLDGNKVTTFVYQPGVATSRPVTAIHADPDGELLLGISKRGLLELRNGQIVPVAEAAALAAETVWTIARLRNGRLLIGMNSGLYERRADRSWQLVTLPGVPQPLVARDLLEEAGGTIWIATEGLGLVRWEKGAARFYDSRAGMVDDTLYSVVDDGLGSLWVSSARGLARIRKTEFAEIDRGAIASLNSLTFGRVDGLLSAASNGSGTPSAIRLIDGRIMTATDNGVAVIAPGSLQVNSQPPTVVIESVVADDQVLPPGQAVTIPAGANRVEIRYTALSLIAPQRLRFRYQLEGSDPGWVEAAHGRSAHYTHLAPGRYTFRVLACNNDGVWSDTGAALAITMQPRFYQTLWFRLAAVVLSIVLLASLVGWRLRDFKQRQQALARANAELDQRVRERTAELANSLALLKHTQETAAQEQARFKFIFEVLPVGISWFVPDMDLSHIVNPAHERITGVSAAEALIPGAFARVSHPDDYQQQTELGRQFVNGQIDHYSLEKRYLHQDGRTVWALLSSRMFVDRATGTKQSVTTLVDITESKETQLKIEQMHRTLLDASRQAGMAEVATGVLHNVGNVLNSVNVSATLVADHVRHTKALNIVKVAALLDEHKADLAGFLTTDARGQMIPAYLGTLAESLTAEHKTMLEEIEHLRKNVEHIKDIVGMQQAYATTSGVIETIAVLDLVEDALRINAGALTRHGVDTVRDYRARPVVATDKYKVMQILINLVRNAKYACDESGRTDKQITVRTTCDEHTVKIAIIDNGVGIPAENLARIFNHGFTTRKEGHGFGLHSGALAARELGGSLNVHSDGPGLGAVFTLEIPYKDGPLP